MDAALRKLLTKRTMAEFGWVSIGQILYMVLGFFSIKLLSTMGPEKYGIYALVITISAILSGVFYGPAEQGFTRFYFEYVHQGIPRRLIKLLYKFLVITAIFFSLASIFLYPVISHTQIGEHPLTFAATVLFILLSTCACPLNSILNALRKRKENALIQAAERGLAVLFMLLLIAFVQLSITMVFLAFALAAIAGIVVRISLLERIVPVDSGGQLQTKDNYQEMIKKITKFSLPFAIWGVSSWFQSSSESWVIAHYLSMTEVGKYAVMIALANYLIAVPHGIITRFITPVLYEKFSQHSDATKLTEGYQYLNIFKAVSFILSGFCILMTLLVGENLLIFISNNEFVDSWYLLPVICTGLGLFHQGQTLSQLGIVLKIPNKYIMPKIVCGLFAILLNIILIKNAGLTGAAISIICSGFVYFIGILYINTKIKATLVPKHLN